MDTNKSHLHLQNRWNLSGLLLADWNWLHLILITFNTLCSAEFYIQWCGVLQWIQRGSYLKEIICPCPESSFSQKGATVGRPPNFFEAHTSVKGNHWNIILYHIITRPILNKILKTFTKDTEVGGQNFGCQLWILCQTDYVTSALITFMIII